ncbi:MAG: Hpt domain-containing protein [Deltaproteobacteria bacterium]|nr:Hpt domain-containing protein [Deltaproteobacteria bacterium]
MSFPLARRLSSAVLALTFATLASLCIYLPMVGVAALGACFAAAWIVGRRMARDLRATSEELQRLARKVENDAARDRALMKEQAAELDERNGAMRRVLDNVGQGLVSVGRDGSVEGERSRALDAWFGAPRPGAKLWDYVGAVDPVFGETLRASWELVGESDLPIDLMLDAFPATLRLGSRFLRCEYRPIEEGGVLTKMLVVVSDVTSQVEKRRIDEAQRELVGLVDKMMADRNGCLELLEETDRLVQSLEHATELTPSFLRALHTIEGNASIYGLQTLVDHCHLAEACIRETNELPPASELEPILSQWQTVKTRLAPLIEGRGRMRYEVTDGDVEALRSAIPFAPRQDLAKMVASWRREPVARRFRRLAQHATSLAERLGKHRVRIVTDAGGVRLDGNAWAPFWAAFMHVVRNAVDHGIESPLERAQKEKLNEGVIVLRAYSNPHEIAIEIADDGRGIDWNALEMRALELGIRTRDRDELEELLFRDGVTTREVVSETSGRGLGMGAVRAACHALGGEVHVESKHDYGTLVRFTFPLEAAGGSVTIRPPLAEAA